MHRRCVPRPAAQSPRQRSMPSRYAGSCRIPAPRRARAIVERVTGSEDALDHTIGLGSDQDRRRGERLAGAHGQHLEGWSILVRQQEDFRAAHIHPRDAIFALDERSPSRLGVSGSLATGAEPNGELVLHAIDRQCGRHGRTHRESEHRDLRGLERRAVPYVRTEDRHRLGFEVPGLQRRVLVLLGDSLGSAQASSVD